MRIMVRLNKRNNLFPSTCDYYFAKFVNTLMENKTPGQEFIMSFYYEFSQLRWLKRKEIILLMKDRIFSFPQMESGKMQVIHLFHNVNQTNTPDCLGFSITGEDSFIDDSLL